MVFFTLMKKAEIGHYIAQRRKSLKVNQRGLAEMCGISEHALCNLEGGEGNPTFDLVYSVADVLGLELVLRPKNMET